jgi:hypothetical protein
MNCNHCGYSAPSSLISTEKTNEAILTIEDLSAGVVLF